MRAALPDISEEDRLESCGGKRSPCQLCSNMKNTSTFRGKYSKEVYQINKKFNCNSKMVVYLIECSVCRKQYKSTTVTKFSTRVNNYKSTHRNFWNGQKLSNQARNQKHHCKHCLENDHNRMYD